MGNCILWNRKTLTLEKEYKRFLPKSERLSVHEKIFSWICGGITAPFQRRVIAGRFRFGNVRIRVINIHLDHNGGVNNRRKQLQYLVRWFRDDRTAKQKILCGDFNSFDLLKRGKEAEMYRVVLRGFVDASRGGGWAADINNIAIANGAVFSQLIKGINLHVRRKLDYVWVKNLTPVDCKTLSVRGSDRRPVVACLEL